MCGVLRTERKRPIVPAVQPEHWEPTHATTDKTRQLATKIPNRYTRLSVATRIIFTMPHILCGWCSTAPTIKPTNRQQIAINRASDRYPSHGSLVSQNQGLHLTPPEGPAGGPPARRHAPLRWRGSLPAFGELSDHAHPGTRSRHDSCRLRSAPPPGPP